MRILFALLLALALPAAAAAAQEWVAVEPMPTPRVGAASAVLDGRLYVMGGRDATGAPLDVVEVFDPAEGWSTAAPLLEARFDADAAVLDTTIVIVGGRDGRGVLASAEAYDATADAWAPFAALPEPREGLEVVGRGGSLFVLGGTGPNAEFRSQSQVYGAGGWSPYGEITLTPARARFGAVEAGGGLLIFGGFSPLGPLQSAQLYLPGQPTLSVFSLGSPRGSFATAIGGGSVFAVGGRDASDQVVADVEQLTGIYEIWRERTPLPTPRDAAVAAVLDDTLYVTGGADRFGAVLGTTLRLPLEVPPRVTSADAPPTAQPALAVVGPNPVRGRTTLEVRAAAPARLTIHDALGREVAVLLDGAVGERRVEWDARVPAGVYLARLAGPAGASVVPLTVVR